MKNKKISFFLHNVVLFYSIKPLIDHYKKESVILLPIFEDPVWDKMSLETLDFLIACGYEAYRVKSSEDYLTNIALSPYKYFPLARCVNIKYQYSLAKNYSTMSYENNSGFDYFFCLGSYDSEILSAYGKTQIIGQLKFIDYLSKKTRRLNKSDKKKNLLYLPTYGEHSSIKEIKKQIKDLSKSFNLKIKIHHGTQYLIDNNLPQLPSNVQIIGSQAKLQEIYSWSDLVLSDASGAIFDAIAADKPVFVLQNDIPIQCEGIDSLETQVVKENLVYAIKNVNTIASEITVNNTENYFKKQQRYKSILFPIKPKVGLLSAINLIDSVLVDQNEQLYLSLHKKSTISSEERSTIGKQIDQANSLNFKLQNNYLNKIKESSRQKAKIARLAKNLQAIEEEVVKYKTFLYNSDATLAQIKSGRLWYLLTRYFNFRDKIRDRVKKLIILGHQYKLAAWLTKRTSDRNIVFINSAFSYSRKTNQTVINLANSFLNKKYLVVFIVWNFSRSDMDVIVEGEIEHDLYQVNMYHFFDYLDAILDSIKKSQKRFFLVTIPSSNYLSIADKLMKYKFNIWYHVLDEWSEFKKVGQADWYDRKAELNFVAISSHISTVSLSLKEKFLPFRNDITILNNGILESRKNNILKNIRSNSFSNKIIIGYVGHLTSSWFDWDLVFRIASMKSRSFDVHFEIIGFGIDKSIEEKVKSFDNIRFYGKIDLLDAQEIIKNWNITIIPFINSKLSQAVDPIKIYEYIYMGFPSLVFGMDWLSNYPLVFCAEPNISDENLVKLVVKAANSINNFDNTEKFISSHTWEQLFDVAHQELIKPKAHIQNFYAE